jgi:hypothetical protein
LTFRCIELGSFCKLVVADKGRDTGEGGYVDTQIDAPFDGDLGGVVYVE